MSGAEQKPALKATVRGTINGRDFVPSRKHPQEHFLADSTARKRNVERDKSRVNQIDISPLRRSEALVAASYLTLNSVCPTGHRTV